MYTAVPAAIEEIKQYIIALKKQIPGFFHEDGLLASPLLKGKPCVRLAPESLLISAFIASGIKKRAKYPS